VDKAAVLQASRQGVLLSFVTDFHEARDTKGDVIGVRTVVRVASVSGSPEARAKVRDDVVKLMVRPDQGRVEGWLNGTLSLAFGSRGKGERNPAAAHDEPGYVVVNLTRLNGAGSLAHEWFHVFDIWRTKYDAKDRAASASSTDKQSRRNEYMIDRARKRGSVAPEIYFAFTKLKRAVKNADGEWFRRSKELDKARFEPYLANITAEAGPMSVGLTSEAVTTLT
jgi:hypothetical protein